MHQTNLLNKQELNDSALEEQRFENGLKVQPNHLQG